MNRRNADFDGDGALVSWWDGERIGGYHLERTLDCWSPARDEQVIPALAAVGIAAPVMRDLMGDYLAEVGECPIPFVTLEGHFAWALSNGANVIFQPPE